MKSVHGWVELGVVSVVLAVLAEVAGCPAGQAPVRGPAPEYERPQLAPWDAGAAKAEDELDPFAAAAESDWVSGAEPEAAGGSTADAAESPPGGAAGSSP